MSQDNNPYSSPAVVECAPATNITSDPDLFSWGKLTLLWDVCFLFGYVWFLGAATMYLGILWKWEYAPKNLSAAISYDAVGYFSFISWSVVALLVGIYLIVRKWRTLRSPWPNWALAGRTFLRSTLVMTPVWILYVWLAYKYSPRLPGEEEWVPISLGALLGILHGVLCKRGLERQQSVVS